MRENMHKSAHAESRLVDTLPDISRGNRLKAKDICVVKMNHTGLSNSKPCIQCLRKLEIYAPLRGYRIRRIYYSDETGKIIKSSLRELLSQPLYFSRGSFYCAPCS
jgi:hypothetical protein